MKDFWFKAGDLVRTKTSLSKAYGLGIIVSVSHRLDGARIRRAKYLVFFPNAAGGAFRQWRDHNELRRLNQ